MVKHYWGYRIDVTQIKYFRSELGKGFLRQGWGWDIKLYVVKWLWTNMIKTKGTLLTV